MDMKPFVDQEKKSPTASSRVRGYNSHRSLNWRLFAGECKGQFQAFPVWEINVSHFSGLSSENWQMGKSTCPAKKTAD